MRMRGMIRMGMMRTKRCSKKNYESELSKRASFLSYASKT